MEDVQEILCSCGIPWACLGLSQLFLLLVGTGSEESLISRMNRLETGEQRLLVLCLLGCYYRFCKECCLGRGGFP